MTMPVSLPPECPYSEDHQFEARYDSYADGTEIYVGEICTDCGLFIQRINVPTGEKKDES